MLTSPPTYRLMSPVGLAAGAVVGACAAAGVGAAVGAAGLAACVGCAAGAGVGAGDGLPGALQAAGSAAEPTPTGARHPYRRNSRPLVTVMGRIPREVGPGSQAQRT